MRRFLALALSAGVAFHPLLPALAAELPYFRYGMEDWRGGLARRLLLAYPPRPVTARANEPFSVTALPSGMDAGSAFSVVGSLPAGLSLAPNGTLSGISASPTTFAPLTIRLTDSTGAAVTAQTPTITVLPQLRFAYPSVLTGVAGAQFTAAPLVWDGIGGSTRIELVSGSIPGEIRFDPLTGVLSGIPPVAGETTATFALVDSSDGRRVSTGETRFVIAPAGPLAVAAATPADGTLNQTYPGFAFAVTGGRAPMTFAITSGTMPTGIGLSKTGVASGTPTAEGTFPVTVQVTDFDGRKVSASATFRVNRALVITAPSLARGTVGRLAAPAVFTVSNADGAVSWVPSGLPDGMQMATDGTLSGTPTTAGTYKITATVTDAGGHVMPTPEIAFYVDSPLVAKGPATLTMGATGSAYPNQTFTTTGGNGSVSWTATGLPTGMSVTSGGRLQGTPSKAGSFTPVFTARDASARTDTVTLPLEISAVFAASAPAIPAASVGVTYGPIRLASAGGNGTVSWTVNAGSPPDGITLSTTGDIQGLPTTAGSAPPFTARATDADGKTADVSVSIPVAAPLVITTPPAFPRGTVGSGYVANPGNAYVASGGRGPISLSASGLFGGIGLSGGLIQGTPNAAGSNANVVVTATDADGRQAKSLVRTLAVDAKLAVTPAVLPADIAGTAMAPFGVQASGGRGALTWTHDAAALHIGVTMDENGVIQGTPTSSGTRTYAVTATDLDGRTATGSVSHTVDPSPTRPSISGAPPASVPASTALDVRPFTVTGGQGPYTFAVGSGYQPPGITVGSDGRISGTPTYSGTWSFTVRVTDSQGRTGEAGPYNMQVASPYTITGSMPTTAKVGQPFSAQFYVSATPTSGKFFSYRRTGTSSWTSASQVVFPGVTIDMATGRISGTPTTAATYEGIEIWHDVGTWIGIGTFKVVVSP